MGASVTARLQEQQFPKSITRFPLLHRRFRFHQYFNLLRSPYPVSCFVVHRLCPRDSEQNGAK